MDAFEAIKIDRAVAVIRAERVADPAALANALADSGIRAVEFTFTIPDVLAAIETAAAKPRRRTHTTATFTLWIGGSESNRQSHFSPPSLPIHS